MMRMSLRRKAAWEKGLGIDTNEIEGVMGDGGEWQ